jgi:hypothetical protein
MFREVGLLSALRFYTWQFVRSITITPRRRQLEAFREQWGRSGSKEPWLASRYFELITAGKNGSTYVDDRTWNDLEFPRIFADIDTTVTRLGGQYLYSQLRIYPEQPAMASDGYRTYQALVADGSLRERIQLTLAYLNPDSCASVAENLFGTFPPNLRFRRLLGLWSALAVVLAVATAVTSLSIIPLLVVAGLNIAVIRRMAPEANKLTETLGGIYRLTRVADALSRIEGTQHIPQLRELAAARGTHASARRAFRTFAALQKAAISGIPVWLNIFFLWEWLAYIQTHDKLEGLRQELRPIFTLVASLDAAIALASFLHRSPAHCRPTWSTEASIEIDAGCHPLLATGVPNSVSLGNRSALVTGSNMAGKTTFIKMIATNLILGRNIGICLAARAVVPLSAVRACIHREHSIESAKSRYSAELEAIKAFFEEASGDTPPVFVIDEPFSGTNTVERIAAAKAVLDALSRRSLVLATTHDVELQEILKHRFDRFHFTEDPDVEGFFDFRIRKGTCTEGNALRLLEKIGFPPAVTAEAVSFAATFAATFAAKRT